MSDNESSAEVDKKGPQFTEKEERVLKAAWRCLKSGPPEIDIEKLTKAAGFNTTKTCSNTWSTIKKKLFSDADGNALPSAPSIPKTPKAKRGTAKKRTKKAVDEDEDEDEDEGQSLLTKKMKPTPLKKIVKAEDSDEE